MCLSVLTNPEFQKQFCNSTLPKVQSYNHFLIVIPSFNLSVTFMVFNLPQNFVIRLHKVISLYLVHLSFKNLPGSQDFYFKIYFNFIKDLPIHYDYRLLCYMHKLSATYLLSCSFLVFVTEVNK